ncbi:hypothetical protein O0Q50_19300 [Priestia aryabhattai]|uniref:Uncharacterized protein n=1 Tax=Priestia aryabhattai TaxID=412384 RepID=A0AAX6NBP3_PRIAR|nr:hypothetical protein [Priestia aryabhattai]MDU9693321.1 hypothetical protein [Priestia aryabhattai]
MRKELRKMLENDSAYADIMELALIPDEVKASIIKEIFGLSSEKEYMKSLILLAVALGSEERCRKDIDDFYNKNEKLLFEYYRESKVGKTFDKSTIKTTEYIKKCFAIIHYQEHKKGDKGIPLFIESLIKKAYKPVISFNMHHRWVKLEQFIDWYKEGKELNSLSGLYLDKCCYVLMYIACKKDKLIYTSEMMDEVNIQFHRLIANHSLEEINKAKIESTVGYKDLLEKLTFKNQISEDVSFIFENIRLLEEDVLLKHHRGARNRREADALYKKMLLTRVISSLTVIMETFGLSSDFLREAKVGNKQLEEITKFIYVIKNQNNLNERETEIAFVMSLLIYAIATEYNSLREGFYEGLKMKVQEQESKEEEKAAAVVEKYQKEIAELQEQLRMANEKNASLELRLKTSEERIAQLEKESERSLMNLNKANENSKEVHFLREYFFDSHSNQCIVEENSTNIEDIIKSLDSVKGVIVGGHPNLTKKLKKKLPSFEFIAETETSRDISFVSNRDIVFVSSVHDNHGLYRKVMKGVNNTNTALTYLIKNQNTDLLIKDMLEKCEEKVKVF